MYGLTHRRLCLEPLYVLHRYGNWTLACCNKFVSLCLPLQDAMNAVGDVSCVCSRGDAVTNPLIYRTTVLQVLKPALPTHSTHPNDSMPHVFLKVAPSAYPATRSTHMCAPLELLRPAAFAQCVHTTAASLANSKHTRAVIDACCPASVHQPRACTLVTSSPCVWHGHTYLACILSGLLTVSEVHSLGHTPYWVRKAWVSNSMTITVPLQLERRMLKPDPCCQKLWKKGAIKSS